MVCKECGRKYVMSGQIPNDCQIGPLPIVVLSFPTSPTNQFISLIYFANQQISHVAKQKLISP